MIHCDVYTDNNFCVGHRKALRELVEELKKKGFGSRYLPSCWMIIYTCVDELKIVLERYY